MKFLAHQTPIRWDIIEETRYLTDCQHRLSTIDPRDTSLSTILKGLERTPAGRQCIGLHHGIARKLRDLWSHGPDDRTLSQPHEAIYASTGHNGAKDSTRLIARYLGLSFFTPLAPFRNLIGNRIEADRLLGVAYPSSNMNGIPYSLIKSSQKSLRLGTYIIDYQDTYLHELDHLFDFLVRPVSRHHATGFLEKAALVEASAYLQEGFPILDIFSHIVLARENDGDPLPWNLEPLTEIVRKHHSIESERKAQMAADSLERGLRGHETHYMRSSKDHAYFADQCAHHVSRSIEDCARLHEALVEIEELHVNREILANSIRRSTSFESALERIEALRVGIIAGRIEPTNLRTLPSRYVISQQSDKRTTNQSRRDYLSVNSSYDSESELI